MSDLPHGWEAVTSQDGVYYWNTESGEVTWKKPSKPSKPCPPPPPPNPPASELSHEMYDFAEKLTATAPVHYQPVQTCYENVILLKGSDEDPHEDDLPPSAALVARNVDNYENVDIIEIPFCGDEANKSDNLDKQDLERYQGPDEDQYTRVNRVSDRKSNFRHSAVKRKLSNNVEELVITREKIDSNGTGETPDIPRRSPTLCSEVEAYTCEEAPSGSTKSDSHQFMLPFSNQYEDVEKPVLISPRASLPILPSYDVKQDPLLAGQWETTATQSVVNSQCRDSGIGLSSSARVNSFQSSSPVKSNLIYKPGTLYENVELPTDKEQYIPTSKLPEGWKEVELDNGQIYYWHTDTGVTQWDFPIEQPLSPETVLETKESTDESSPPSNSSLIVCPQEPTPEAENARNFSAWLLDIQDVDVSEIKHGNCSTIIENCIQSMCDRLEGDEQVGEREVVLQVSPGVLKELDAATSSVNKAYSITRIRAWGCSRENSRYFAYIIRHSKSQTYKCNIYKCSTSAKSLTLALKELSTPAQAGSDSSCHSSPKSKRYSTQSVTDKENSVLHIEEGEKYQRFNVTYLGSIRVAGDSGIELVCSSLDKLKNQPANWMEASIDIFTTHFRIVEAKTGDVLTETRVRFLSFLGLSNDDSMCGYITGDEGTYFCLGFKMEPNSIQLSLAMKHACEDRFQRVCKGIPDNSTSSSASLKKSAEIPMLMKAEIAGEKIGGYLKSRMTKVSKQVGFKLQRTPSTKTIYGTYQVQLYGSAQVPMENDKRAVEEAISYLESQSTRLTNPYVIEFQITQSSFIFLDKEKRKFSKKIFSINNIRYCLKKGHSVAFVVQNKSGLFDAYALGEINTSAGVIIETIQAAVNGSP